MNMLYKVIALCFLAGVLTDEHNHIYEDNEEVVLWISTVGPYSNPQETYSYFSLPFCIGARQILSRYQQTLSEALQGVELQFSGLDIQFKADVQKDEFCRIQLSDEKVNSFVYAVKNDFWFQMYIDELPIRGSVGEVSESNYYIWTHKKFEIGYNGKQIVDVNITSDDKVELSPNRMLLFTYEVIWKPSKLKFEDRLDKYLDSDFFLHKIHWISSFCSFMMAVSIVGLVSIIFKKTLRKDEDMDVMERNLGDENGWKPVHGDVFRPPSHSLLFCALIGAGHQLTLVVFCVIVFAIFGDSYTGRGFLLSTTICAYTLTSPVNGYFGGSLYARMGGNLWIRQMLLSAFILPAFVCGTGICINFIAVYYHSSRAIAFETMFAVSHICLFIILPFTWLGTVVGRNVAGQSDYPCQINAFPRPIPKKKWFLEPGVLILLGGVLPFASIFMEMDFIFASFWANKIYYAYGFILIISLILVVVSICVTIVCTYFLLNAEDYRWQWTSFLATVSTSAYVYIYCIYYFFFKTKMYGLFQIVFYFGYMAVFSGTIGIMCGTVGFIGTSMYVRKIYSQNSIQKKC